MMLIQGIHGVDLYLVSVNGPYLPYSHDSLDSPRTLTLVYFVRLLDGATIILLRQGL